MIFKLLDGDKILDESQSVLSRGTYFTFLFASCFSRIKCGCWMNAIFNPGNSVAKEKTKCVSQDSIFNDSWNILQRVPGSSPLSDILNMAKTLETSLIMNALGESSGAINEHLSISIG